MKALWGEAGRPIRFVIAGGWNTVFGVLTYAGLYYGTRPPGAPHPAHYLSVLIVSNVLAVTQAYLCYKYFVFRTAGNFVREFFRFSMVYAVTFAFNLVSLPVLVTFVGMAPVTAQAVIVAVSAVASYVGHNRLSFNSMQRSGERATWVCPGRSNGVRLTNWLRSRKYIRGGAKV